MPNPYTLVFGQPPLELIERKAQAERIISEFSQERPSNYLNLITGIRGCGKTVFITNIANTLREDKQWIVIDLNPQRDLLHSLAAKLSSNQFLQRIFREAEINLEAFGFGFGIKGAPVISDIEEALIRMLRSIKKQNKRVLVTVDEATNSKEMKAFASAYQIFLREELPIFLLMTGLFKSVDKLRNSEGMTFLERAPRTVLSPLNYQAMVEKYQETLDIPQAAATRLARMTRGYSFAFQTIGYFSWEYPDSPDEAFRNAKEYLYEFSYNKIWSELSRKDREVAKAVAKVPGGEIIKIRELLDYSSNQFNPYRDRLIKEGVLQSPGTGLVEFTLPWFEDYCIEERG